MSEQQQSPEVLATHIMNRSAGRNLGNYVKTVRAFEEAMAALAAADEAIAKINEGLPMGFKVGTESAFSPDEDYNQHNVGGYNTIYRLDEAGDYVAAGGICTEGMTLPFLGNRLARMSNGELAVINDDLQLGLATKHIVFVVDTNNDPKQNTIGGSEQERFEKTLLPMIQEVPFGEQIAYDCLYY